MSQLDPNNMGSGSAYAGAAAVPNGADPLGGQTALTSKTALIVYYIIGCISQFTGFIGLFVWIGALMSGSTARKEGAEIVARHCKWLSRSVWIYTLIGMTLLCWFCFEIGSAVVNLPEGTNFEDYDALFANEGFMNALWDSLYILGGYIIMWLWFFYRMIRGIIALVGNKAP